MTKQQFKRRWESDAEGGGITYDEIAECAVLWNISSRPKICAIDEITYKVLQAAKCSDAETFKP